MDHTRRQFARQAKSEIRDLIELCESMPGAELTADSWADPPSIESIPNSERDEFEHEAEIIIRSSVGGSASLAFFIPYLWRHRH